jgi:hypothetical protein
MHNIIRSRLALGVDLERVRETYANIDVHDARYVLLESDAASHHVSFDNDFDKYFERRHGISYRWRPEQE